MSAQAYSAQGSTFSLGATGTAITAITAITQANPAVATKTAHGLVAPALVRITGATGMTQINGLIAVARPIDANTIELSGINSTAFTAYSGTSGQAAPAVFKLNGWKSWSASGAPGQILDTTDLDDPVKTQLTGLAGPGTMTLNMQRLSADEGQRALIASKRTPGVNLPLTLTSKTTAGVVTYTTTGACADFVIPGSGGVDQIVETTATINLGADWV